MNQRNGATTLSQIHPDIGKDIAKENKELKGKLMNYYKSLEEKKYSKNDLYQIQKNNIMVQLERQAFRINTMLSRKAVMKDILPNCEEKATASKELAYNGRLKCKKEYWPLTIHITVVQGLMTSCIYLSTTIERPTKKNHDKKIILKT